MSDNTEHSRAPGAPAEGGAAIDLGALYRQLHDARAALGSMVRLRWRVGEAVLWRLERETLPPDVVIRLTPEDVARGRARPLIGVPVEVDRLKAGRPLCLEALVGGQWIIPETRVSAPGGGWSFTVAEPIGRVLVKMQVSRGLLGDAGALRSHIEGVALALAADRHDNPLVRLDRWEALRGDPSFIGLDLDESALIIARVDVL